MILETTWFILWGVLWAIYFMLDGFDLGLGLMMPSLSRSELDRRIIFNAMGPFWDGNEVWLITAGGVTFAAFPKTYAIMFSALYSPLLLILFALILRGISFEFRRKVDHPVWRGIWDACMIGGSGVTALLFGVAFANIFQGIPINETGIFQGNLLTLLNPYGIAGGLLFVALFAQHGSLWLVIKSTGELSVRAQKTARFIWPVTLILAVIFLILTHVYTPLYHNYMEMPVLWIIPLLTVIGLFLTRYHFGKNEWHAWFSSCLTIGSAVLFGVAGIYPNLLPSSIDPNFSLSIFNSASSPLTLKIMLGVTLVCIPVVIFYQTVIYRLFREKISNPDLEFEEAY